MDAEKQHSVQPLGGGEAMAGAEGPYALPRRGVILTMAGVMLAMFLASIDQTVVSTAMPRIIADLGGFDRYTWVTTAYLVTATPMIPIVGRLTDMYGRKWFYVVGIIVFLLASVLSGTSQTLTQLIIFRALQGIGGGIMMASAFIVVGDLFPPAERGKYQGLITAVFGLSSVVGPTLGGFLTDNLSWHWIFYINLPLGIPAVFLFIRFFPHVRPAMVKHRIDILGLTLLVLFVVPLMLGLSWGGVQYEWGSPQVIGALTVGVLMALIFVVVESRAAEPIMPLGIFRNRVISFASAAYFFVGFGMFGGIIFIPLFFQGVLGASATRSGSFLTPMMLGVVVGSLVSGQAVSRLGGHYRIQGLMGLALMGTGMFLLSRMTVDASYSRAVFNIVLMGVGMGTALPLYTLAAQNAVPYSMMGVATSSVHFARSIGGVLGLAIFGSLMANRFASGLATLLPTAVKEALPAGTLSELSSNPQALMDPNAVSDLKEMLGGLGLQEGADLQVMQALRESLATAISDVFLLGLAIVGVAFVVHMFLKEIPLRRHHVMAEAGEGQPIEVVAEEPNLAKANPEFTDCHEKGEHHSSKGPDKGRHC